MDLHRFILPFAIILISAPIFPETAARFDIPSAIDELLAVLLVGPSLPGWVTPDTTKKLLTRIVIIQLLFEIGHGYQPELSGALRLQTSHRHADYHAPPFLLNW